MRIISCRRILRVNRGSVVVLLVPKISALLAPVACEAPVADVSPLLWIVRSTDKRKYVVRNETNVNIFIFLEFYEPASRQSPAPQTVRQREEVGPDLRPGAVISDQTSTHNAHTPAIVAEQSIEVLFKVQYGQVYTHSNAYSVLCLQERFQVKNPPHTYIQKLRGYLDPGVTRKVGHSNIEST